MLLATALLTGCGGGSEDGDAGPGSDSGLPAPSTTGDAPTDGTEAGGETGSGAERIDGTLGLRVDGARLFLTATAAAEPLVVLADLSTAKVTADGSRWKVVIARPDGAQDPQADTPGTWDAVVVQPGASIEVGPYELGPRPPTDVELCLEVVAPRPNQARLATGDMVQLEDRRGATTYLCNSRTLG